MTEPFAVFRCDASAKIGVGHVMRCLTLADELSACGWRAAFVVSPETLNTVPALLTRGHDVMPLPNGEMQDSDLLQTQFENLKIRYPSGCDWLVVDHYGLDAEFEGMCRNWAGSILVIDDLADRPHKCDTVLDMSLDHGIEKYADLLVKEGTFLSGPRYALLRPQFRKSRQQSLSRRKDNRLERLLISLGGTVSPQIIEEVLAGVHESGLNLKVDVVGGLCAGEPPQTDSNIHWYTGVDNMAVLMSQADLSIGAGGTTSWERCALGLPTVMLSLADNQCGNIQALTQAGAACATDIERTAIAQCLQMLPDLESMSKKAAEICDGWGDVRTTLFMTRPETARDGGEVKLRLADMADVDFMYDWQCHPDTRRFARNQSTLPYEEHVKWVCDCVNDPDRYLCVVTHGGVDVGVLRLDRLEVKKTETEVQTYEVSIYINPDKYRLGLAHAALAFARAWRQRDVFRAFVMDENISSRALFLAAGYIPDGDQWYIHKPIVTGNVS